MPSPRPSSPALQNANGRRTIDLFLFLLLCPLLVMGRHCYSCSGQCMVGAPCNCQMGSCEADFCFAEKKPSEIPGIFRLSKGCVRRPARTRGGCDFDHFADHVLCVCNGPGDFCNDHILMRVNTASWRNVTCRMCPDGRPDCGQTCQGQWCHQKTSTGASGCGFGPPSLPYLYQSHELFRHNPKVCLSMSRGGTASPHRFCVCIGHFCNEPEWMIRNGGDDREEQQSAGSRKPSPTLFASLFRSLGGGGSQQQQQQQRSIGHQREMVRAQRQPPMYQCVSCDLSSENTAALTSNCRQNHCKGQFCVYAAQRIFNGPSGGQWQNGQREGGGGSAVMHEKQGCINVTEPAFVQLGCAHKWVQNELEEIYCACRGDLCNVDLMTASASSAPSTNKGQFSAGILFFPPFAATFLPLIQILPPLLPSSASFLQLVAPNNVVRL